MSDITRKLATIERILAINPHPNADKLEIATVRGWEVVVQKDLYHVGEQILYIEVDSFLPIGNPELEFLRKNCFRSTAHLGDGFKIKTVKLRGEISQGLIMPLEDFPEFSFNVNLGSWVLLKDVLDFGVDMAPILVDGSDVTEILGIKLWETPLSPALSGIAKGIFPTSIVPKTDQIRWQNLGRLREGHVNDEFEVTIKMDGSSMTVIWYKNEFRVCSRNLELKEIEDNLFWKVANKTRLKESFNASLVDDFIFNVAIQGELIGPGIQGNPHKLDHHYMYVFDIYNIDFKKYEHGGERLDLITEYNELFENDVLRHVPVLIENFNGIPNKEDLEKLMALSPNSEGIVFKSLNDPNFSFKYINPRYDLKSND